MQAYHNEQSFKDRFMTEIRWHKATDSIRQGAYWSAMERGCAIGCSINSLVRMGEVEEQEHLDYSDHDRLSGIINVPVALLHLEDALFESLTYEQAPDWPERFADAITAGADLSMVFPKWVLWLVTNEQWNLHEFFDTAEQQRQAQHIINWVKALVDGESVYDEDWKELSDQMENVRTDMPSYRGTYAVTAMQYVAESMREDDHDCMTIVISNWKQAHGRHNWGDFIDAISDKLIELLREAA